MKKPFILVPWNTSLLDALLHTLTRSMHPPDPFLVETESTRKGSNFSSIACIFPNSRPGMYCTERIKKAASISRPLIMPGYHTSSSLISSLRAALADTPAKVASQLDRVGLIMDCVRAIPELASLLYHGYANRPAATTSSITFDTVRFFPWGIRLASLFEECLTQAVEPENFLYTEDRATPYATLLLANLKTLFTLYCTRLLERGWTTPGYDAFLVARHIIGNNPLPPLPMLDKHLFFCGFYHLNGTENIVFRHLWEQRDATFLLHTDTSPAPHWSCAPLTGWLDQWKANSVQFTPPVAPENVATPAVACYEGFDLHSQFEALKTHFASLTPCATVPPDKASHDAETAIILPDSSLLMPLLHHLPDTDINISMGYPLSRSPLFRLIDSVLRLHESKRYALFYWKDMVEILRHPYIKMLRPEEDLTDAETNHARPALPLRRELYLFEQELRKDARPFTNPFAILHNLHIDQDPEEQPAPQVTALLEDLFDILFNRFASPVTTAQLADALTDLCTMLLKHGAPLFERFPIDRECLFRLFKSFIPELKTSALAEETFPPATVFAIARQLMEADRVPFEATPLVGLQVLGMLETRLLSFRHILIPECTEASLPGISTDDPLLPDSLRREIGLPAGTDRETVAAYHFHRLIAGAETVTLFWQEGTHGSGIQDGKKRRSRFIEELVWKQEKALGHLLGPDTDNPAFRYTTLASAVGPMSKGKDCIPITPEIRARVNSLLASPLSASLFDIYLTCPARFYYSRILRLDETEEIAEAQDPRTIGAVMHRTLELYYGSRLNLSLDIHADNLESHIKEMDAVLKSLPDYTQLENVLSTDAFILFNIAAQTRLSRMLTEQPTTTVIGLEQKLDAPLPLTFTSGHIRLTGKIDRVDRRYNDGGDEIFTVLDYKTGNIYPPKAALWKNDALWQALYNWTPDQALSPDKDVLPTLAKSLGSVQLPLYVLLLSLGAADTHTKRNIAKAALSGRINAAWVDLAETGQEVPLFHNDMTCEQRQEAVTQKLPLLINFLAHHMSQTPCYYPLEGPHCDHCPYSIRCLVSER